MMAVMQQRLPLLEERSGRRKSNRKSPAGFIANEVVFTLHQGTMERAQPLQHGYEPPSSVWYGEDAALLEKLSSFYPRKTPKRILDATVNGGRFWRGSSRPVIGLDIELGHRPAVVADNTKMPFRDKAFDVVVYDPPHIPNQGRDKSKDFNVRFGLGLRSPKEKGYTFSHTYPPFVQEAYRVLKPEGVLLCKITDYIHHHRYQWAHVEFIEAARMAGFKACDCIIKVRKGADHRPQMEGGSPYAAAALLLACFSKVSRVRVSVSPERRL